MAKEDFEFPDQWDDSNERAHLFFDKCYSYTNTLEDMMALFDISFVYYILCVCIFVYFIVTSIVIFACRKNYRFLNNNAGFTFLFSLGGLINVVNSFLIQVYYVEYPCFAMLFCTGISYPLLIIPCIGYILTYLKQCYFSNYAYDKIANDDLANTSFSEPTLPLAQQSKVITHRLLNKFSKYFTEKFITKFLALYIVGVIIYSLVIGLTSSNYSINPLEKGFCILTLEYAPQLFLIFFFFLFFLPFSVFELFKLNDSINMKKSLMFTTIFMFISLLGYFVMSLIPSYNCSKYVKYWPSDSFVILLCISYHYTQITRPLISIFYLNLKAKKLVVSKQGLTKILQDRIFFSEFTEECKNGRCVENILFYIEYKKYKAMLNSKQHKSSIALNDIDEVSTSSTPSNKFRRKSSFFIDGDRQRRDTADTTDEFRIFIADDTNIKNNRKYSEGIDIEKHYKSEERLIRTNSVISQTDRKIPIFSNIKEATSNAHMKWSSTNIKHAHSIEEIIARVNYIYMKFIKSYSDYELNLTAKCVKKIAEFVDAINKLTKNNELVSILNVSGLNFDNVFDQAFDEVLDTLYLNVYMQYVVKKQQKDKKLSKV